MSFSELDRQITEYCEDNHIFGMLRVTVKGNSNPPRTTAHQKNSD